MLLIASLARHFIINTSKKSQKTTRELLTLASDCKKPKNCKKIETGGSVTGVPDAMRPVQLTNRFQPQLQMPSTDDADAFISPC